MVISRCVCVCVSGSVASVVRNTPVGSAHAFALTVIAFEETGRLYGGRRGKGSEREGREREKRAQ